MDIPPYENPYKSTGPTLTPDASGPDDSAAKALVKPPAMILMILSIISIVLSGGVLIFSAGQIDMAIFEDFTRANPVEQEKAVNVIGNLVGLILSIPFHIFFIFACKKMMKLESKSVVWMMLILAVIPCCTPCCLGLPIGIWGIVVMNDPIVKLAFK
ncbi:MAG: hypothetical protein HN617_16645 [Planctomycetaceae bacterium]|jgi:hypothetical protein|nr:hypothetical protein [Planctomycetaceae bacterium]MBT4010745.1 hypothetical protein [Planctomycetaceae bacterium]MBT5125408.1 hypothetical protein [Planctomycetaceae bacterium]MBT5599881.1 hypothetical protein [Planctomycetaceae bacterium]MBT5884188.1 hypothetical protein [Planctomycetaceae bacterium]